MQIWDVPSCLDHLDKYAFPGLFPLPCQSGVERQGEGQVRQWVSVLRAWSKDALAAACVQGRPWTWSGMLIAASQVMQGALWKGSTIYSLNRFHKSFTLYFQIGTAQMGFYWILKNITTTFFFPSLFKVNKYYIDIHLWTNSQISYSKLPPLCPY